MGERDGTACRSRTHVRVPDRYRWQWYWDSCFAAIAWRHLDPARSRAELETLLAAARPDGFIGHTIFWEHPVSGPRELFYNVIDRDDAMTSTIQPPALAFAWSMAVGDPALEPRIVAHHEAVSAQRDLDGDGLLWILQPDESGLDASPQFDPIWRHRAQGLPGFVELVSAQPRARVPDRCRARRRRSGRLRGAHERDPRALAPRARASVDHAGADRRLLRRGERAVPAGGHAGDRRADPPDLGGALPARAARPSRADRTPARRVPARRASVLDGRRTVLRLAR